MSKPVNCTIKNPARSEGGISGNWVTARAAIPGARLIQQIDIARSRFNQKTYMSLTNTRAAVGKTRSRLVTAQLSLKAGR